MQGENVQRCIEVVETRGEEGWERVRCLRASQGAGRSRKMAFAAMEEGGVVEEEERKPS